MKYLLVYTNTEVVYASNQSDIAEVTGHVIKILGTTIYVPDTAEIEVDIIDLETRIAQLELIGIDCSFVYKNNILVDVWKEFTPERNIRVTIPMIEVLKSPVLSEIVNQLRQVLPSDAWGAWDFNRKIRVYLEEIAPEILPIIENYTEYKQIV